MKAVMIRSDYINDRLTISESPNESIQNSDLTITS